MASDPPQTTIAILPFENGAGPQYSWLSSGASDTLLAKFSQVDGITLVEREKIDEVVGHPKRNTSHQEWCRLLGADYLILGSFTVSGETLRFNARIISSKTATLVTKTSLSVQGPVQNILELQTELAQGLAQKCQLRVPFKKLSYRDGHTVDAFRLYNMGKLSFAKGRGIEYTNSEVSFSHPNVIQHISSLKDAVSLLVKAQQYNESYFVEAHFWEGQARKALVRATQNQKERMEIQSTYVKKFEADAAQAAPAFYNLGIAHQSVSNPTKAISAFDNFLKWHDSSARPLQWEEKLPNHQLVKTEEAPYYFLHGKRELEQGNFGQAKFGNSWRHWVLTKKAMVVFTQSHIEKRELASGKLLWKYKVTFQNQLGNRVLTQYPNILVVRGGKIFWCNMKEIEVLDLDTGQQIQHIETGLPQKCEGSFYVFEKQNRMILHYRHGSGKKGQVGAMAWGIEGGKQAWKKDMPYSPINAYHQGTWYTTLQNKELLAVNCRDGSSKVVATFDEPIRQIWPHQDHLLLRCTDQPRVYLRDHFHRWSYRDQSTTPEPENIFFNYFYDSRIPNIEKMKVPFMGANDPYVHLIPANFFYPHTFVSTMDNKGNSSYDTRLHTPSYRKDGDRLFGWSTDQTVFGHSLDKGELAWKKTFPNSTSSMDIKGDLALIKDKHQRLYAFNTQANPYTKWYLDAFVRKSHCLRGLNQMEEAISTLNLAYTNSNDDVQVNLALGNLHLHLGNMNESLEHYARVLKKASSSSSEYQEARKILSTRLGLTKHLHAPPWRSGIYNNSIFISGKSFQGIQRYDIHEDTLIPQYIKDFENYWSLMGNTIIYKDHQHRFHRKDLHSDLERELFQDPRISLNEEDLNGVNNTLTFYFTRYQNLLLYMVREEKEENRIIVARDLDSGKVQWERNISGYVSISPKGPLVFGVLDKEKVRKATVHRIDTKTGKSLWETEVFLTSHNLDHSVDDSMICVAEMSGEDLVVSFRYPHNRYSTAFRFEPKWPFHHLNPENGQLKNTHLGQELVNGIRRNHKNTVFHESTWGFGHNTGHQYIIQHHWNLPTSFHVTEADFNENHPVALAKFKPLAHLSREFDLSKHADVLNGIIKNEEKRKSFIQWALPIFKKRWVKASPQSQFTPMGHEPLQNTLRLMLQRGAKDAKEEKFIARQLMSLYNNREPFVNIRAFRKPSGARFSGIRDVIHFPSGEKILIGHYRSALMAADVAQNNKNLNTWKRMPILNNYRTYFMGINDMDYNKDWTLVKSKSGLYIYKTPTLINYMKHNVLYEEGCFSVDTPVTNLAHAVDGDLNTSTTLHGPQRKVIGLDLGVEMEVNGLTVSIPKGSEQSLGTAIVMASTFSETGKFQEVATFPDTRQAEMPIYIPFSSPVEGRYFKVVFSSTNDISISELSVDLQP